MAKVQDMCRCFYTDSVSDLIMYKCEVHWKVFGATLRESSALNRQVEDMRVEAGNLAAVLMSLRLQLEIAEAEANCDDLFMVHLTRDLIREWLDIIDRSMKKSGVSA